MMGLGIGATLFSENKKNDFLLMFINFLISIPFLCLHQFWILFERTNQISENFFQNYLTGLKYYFDTYNIVFLPWWFFLIIILCYIFLRHSCNKFEKKIILYSVMLIFISLFAIPFITRYCFYRYMVFIVPLTTIITSIVLYKLINVRPFLGSFLALFLFIFQIAGVRQAGDGSVMSLIVNYAYELVHKGDDVNKVLCDYISENASPEDSVVCNYGDFPIIFY